MKVLDGIYVKECIGCGFCCVQTTCDAGRRLYNNATPCPALLFDELKERHFCKLMQLPGILGEQYREELYAGEGCSSGLNSWRHEKIIDRTKPQKQEITLSTDLQVFLKCISQQFISSDVFYLVLLSFKEEITKFGYSETDAEILGSKITTTIIGQRNSFTENFMG